jgi:DhnA family fructose-bisphosphate aldolase class Ia
MNSFHSAGFFPDSLLRALIDARVDRPTLSLETAHKRARRTKMTDDGKLNIIAADHPARFVSNVGANPIGMADRRNYLARILRVLTSEGVDGVMATMDILEDLLIVDALRGAKGLPALLDGKVLIASLNRGGLAGAPWELDDPITGPTAATCAQWRLDGAKMLLRIEVEESLSLKTMLACAQAISACNAFELPMFLEPLPVVKMEKGYGVVKTAEAVARLAGVSSALGDSSRNLWLKLPYTENFSIVAASTTLPIVLLGGESVGDPRPFLQQLENAMAAGYNVRGAMVGRNVIFPGDADPGLIAGAVGNIIHQGWSTERAAATIGETASNSATLTPLYPAGGVQ